jgi:cell division protein FtsL
MIGRLNLILLAAIVATAIYLVHVQFQVRNLFIERDQSMKDWTKLQAHRDQIYVQDRGLRSLSRIARLASGDLNMHNSRPDITLYIRDGKIINTIDMNPITPEKSNIVGTHP